MEGQQVTDEDNQEGDTLDNLLVDNLVEGLVEDCLVIGDGVGTFVVVVLVGMDVERLHGEPQHGTQQAHDSEDPGRESL